MHVEAAGVDLQARVEEVPLHKIERQARRARELSGMLNLEIDLYE